MKKLSVWVVSRVLLGWIFFWAFIDKMWGLGFATKSGNAWLDGVSPTTGFLKFGVTETFENFFHVLAGNVWVDWLFMAGLLGIGLSLMLGVALRISTVSGIVMLLLIYLALFPIQHNPLIDEHILYAVFLWGVYRNREQCGARWWRKLRIISRWKFLE